MIDLRHPTLRVAVPPLKRSARCLNSQPCARPAGVKFKQMGLAGHALQAEPRLGIETIRAPGTGTAARTEGRAPPRWVCRLKCLNRMTARTCSRKRALGLGKNPASGTAVFGADAFMPEIVINLS